MGGKTGPDHRPALQQMFREIAPHYILMNRLITFGMDQSWRKKLVKAAGLPRCAHLLDVGSGTGDIAIEAVRRDPTVRVTAIDFTPEMMKVGMQRKGAERVFWCCGDAMEIPFPEKTFDAVVSGYLLRNVKDVLQALKEQLRVVKPGGYVVALDTSPPPKGLLRPLLLFYLQKVIPWMGRMVSGNREAYEYLPTSTRRFLRPEELAQRMAEAGLVEVRFQQLMIRTQVLLIGRRKGVWKQNA